MRRSSLQILRAVWFALTIREVQALTGRRRLGTFWALAEPVLHVLVLSLVMSVLRQRADIAGHPYPVFLVTGLVPFLAYRRIVLLVAEGVGSARALMAYRQITPLDTFVVKAIMAVGLMALVYAVISAAFEWYGWSMQIHRPLEWLLVIALGFLFSFGLALVLAAIVNAIPESSIVIRMVFMPLYFISGVIIPATHLPPQFLPYLLWNPLLHVTELTRVAALDHFVTVQGVSATYVAAVSGVLLFAGLGLYRVFRFRYVAIRGQ